MQVTHPEYDIGSIYWLPARDKVPLVHLYATVHIDSGCFDHPVLILWVNPLKTEVIILLITSFGGKDLLARHPRDTRARSLHLPIYPSNTHPDNGSRLFLRDDARLPRNSYVKIEHQRKVKTVLLEPTRHALCTLRKDSYNELVRHIAFHPPVTISHQKTQQTHNISGSYGKWPALVAPAVGGGVKPPWEGRRVVHARQALPSRQIQQAARPQHVQQILSPRQTQRPPTILYIQHDALRSPLSPSRQTERTPVLQPVQPVPYNTNQARTHANTSQGSYESCGIGSIMIILVVGIFVWVLWRTANA